MCKQYTYTATCHTPACNSTIGSRKRNRYCPEALQARRLGHCASNIQAAGEFPLPTKAYCRLCKLRENANEEEEAEEDEYAAVQTGLESEVPEDSTTTATATSNDNNYSEEGTVATSVYQHTTARFTPISDSDSSRRSTSESSVTPEPHSGDTTPCASQDDSVQDVAAAPRRKRKRTILESWEDDLRELEREFDTRHLQPQAKRNRAGRAAEKSDEEGEGRFIVVSPAKKTNRRRNARSPAALVAPDVAHPYGF